MKKLFLQYFKSSDTLCNKQVSHHFRVNISEHRKADAKNIPTKPHYLHCTFVLLNIFTEFCISKQNMSQDHRQDMEFLVFSLIFFRSPNLNWVCRSQTFILNFKIFFLYYPIHAFDCEANILWIIGSCFNKRGCPK